MKSLNDWQRFLQLLLSPRILCNALKVSAVVGTLLNLINQGEYLLAGQGVMLGHLLLNYLVPFCVSSYSAARALPLRQIEQGERALSGVRVPDRSE